MHFHSVTADAITRATGLPSETLYIIALVAVAYFLTFIYNPPRGGK